MKEARPLTDEEKADRWYDGTEKVYRAKVTGRHAITLPAKLCQEFEIEAGDVVEFRVRYGSVTMRKSDAPPPLEARGILAKYRHESMEAIVREIRDGRGTWTAEDEAEYQKNRQSAHVVTSGD